MSSATPAVQEPQTAASELTLEPAQPDTTATPERVASSVRVDEATAKQIAAAVDSFVDSLLAMDAKSPAFEQKVQSISRMGNDEIRRSAAVSQRFLDRPTTSLQRGPLAQGSQVSTALLSLRQQIEELDPSRQLRGRRGFLGRTPFGRRVNDYFRRYESAQSTIEGIIQGLYRGQDELLRDNAALEQEKGNLWATKERLEQYVYMAGRLDESVTAKVGFVEALEPDKAKALKEDVLFYVRQKRQDLLTQLSVNVQAYLALDLIRKNNVELVKGVERATTTTVSALRTAVIAALALGNQRLVLDQVNALNMTTGNLIESTSQMLRQQTGEIQNQAASATISIEKLQAAFDNVYATIDSIDQFKVAALETMRKTVDTLSDQVSKAQVYIERARSSEAGQARTDALAGELSLASASKAR
jgi:uncharacterized protein YaaN involved in tellurite resistance